MIKIITGQQLETKGYKLNTPEERSWLEGRLFERTVRIRDGTVRRYYLNDFRERFAEKREFWCAVALYLQSV